MRKSIHAQLGFQPSLVPAVRTATAAGSSIDTLGFSAIEFAYQFGAGGITFDSSNKIGLKLEHSDDDSTFTACADADVVGFTGLSSGVFKEFTSAQSAQVVKVGYVGRKRYVKPSLVFTGTHGTGTASAIQGVLGQADLAPVA